MCQAFEEFGTCSVHGDKKQFERDAALKQFVNCEKPLMFVSSTLDLQSTVRSVAWDGMCWHSLFGGVPSRWPLFCCSDMSSCGAAVGLVYCLCLSPSHSFVCFRYVLARR